MVKSKKLSLKASFSKFQEKKYQDQVEKSRETIRIEQSKKKSLNRAGNSAKLKGKQRAQESIATTIIPFSPTDTILLIGEGNFSFARALFISNHPQLQHLPPANVTATAYDSEEACYEKYPDARDIVKDLQDRGVNVIFGVDATGLHLRKEFKGRKWKKIVWNFPHAGKGIADQDRNILSNQVLILSFLRCAASLLQNGDIPSIQKRRNPTSTSDEALEDEVNDENDDLTKREYQKAERGTILLTLKNVPPYTLWDVPSLAKKPPANAVSKHESSSQPRYIQLRSFKFNSDIWKGYSHRMTKGWVEGIARGCSGEDRTWEFCLAD